jgi:transposase
MAVYSEDLRVKVVEFLEKRHTQKEAAEVFGVSAKSVWIWNKMHKEGKRLVFKFVPRSPHRINHEKLLAYVKEHPDAYLREIAAHFSVAITTIWNALHRLGVTYKKTHNLSRSGLEKTGKICRISKKTVQK